MTKHHGNKLIVKVWFLCKLCGASFRHLDRFIYHKEQRHFKEFQRDKFIIFEESVLVQDDVDREKDVQDSHFKEDEEGNHPTNSVSLLVDASNLHQYIECDDSDFDFESDDLTSEYIDLSCESAAEHQQDGNHYYNVNVSGNSRGKYVTTGKKNCISDVTTEIEESDEEFRNQNQQKGELENFEEGQVTQSLMIDLTSNQEAGLYTSHVDSYADSEAETAHFDLHIDPDNNITIVRSSIANNHALESNSQQPKAAKKPRRKRSAKITTETEGEGKSEKRRKSRLFVFPTSEDEGEDDQALTLREWLLTQMSLEKESSEPNVILLEPDPTVLNLGPITPQNPIECKLCCKFLDSDKEVRIHVAHCYYHNKSRHNYCVPCQKKFPNPFYLRRHSVNIHGTEEERANRYIYQCSLCPKKFMEKRRFYLHTESHKSREEQCRPFVCEYCGKSFIIEYHLNQHIKRHSEDRPFVCSHPGCSQSFKTKQILRIHVQIHSDAKPFKCPHPGCGKSFRYKRYVGMHLPVHTQQRRFECNVDNCHKKFSTSFTLKVHMKSKHGIQGNLPEYKCHICNKIYHMKQSLHTHFISVHTVDKPYRCTFKGCKSAFKIKYQLDHHTKHVHMQTNDGMEMEACELKPYKCHFCPQSFRLQYFLNNHLAIHSEERPFLCPHPNCSLSFKTKNGLHIHKQIHSSVKRFKCPENGCPKTFRVKRYMSMHVDQVHRGYRPYECSEDGCRKKFYNANGYKIHLKTKHRQSGQLPKFVCHVCGMSFYKKTFLQKHSILVHDQVPVLMGQAEQGHLKN